MSPSETEVIFCIWCTRKSIVVNLHKQRKILIFQEVEKLALNLHNPWKILILQEICE